MILMILVGALVVLDVLAFYYGVDSRNLLDHDGPSRRLGLGDAGDGC